MRVCVYFYHVGTCFIMFTQSLLPINYENSPEKKIGVALPVFWLGAMRLLIVVVENQ